MTKIESTTDYESFHFFEGNRRVFDSHVKTLVREIKKNNLLHLCPILVDRDFFVIDGQHRLFAAKALNVPIYYMIADKGGSNLIGTLNSARKAWLSADYVNYFVSQGNEDYRRLDAFCKKHNVDVTLVLKMRDQKDNKFKDGLYKFMTPEEEKTLVVALDKLADTKALIDLRSFIEHKSTIFKSFCFQKPLLTLFLREDFDYDHFRKNLELLMDRFKKCSNKESFYNLFIEIYNYRRKERIE